MVKQKSLFFTNEEEWTNAISFYSAIGKLIAYSEGEILTETKPQIVYHIAIRE